MGELDEFKQIVKNSFKNFREHMDKLDSQIQENQKNMLEILELIKSLKSDSIKPILPKQEIPKQSSTGNKGDYSFIHSFIHSPMHSLCTQNDPEKVFQSLTNKEFLLFLTVFQLESTQQVTYEDLSRRLKLSLGCIRTYVSSIIKKSVPLIKTKLNNRITLLSIDKAFRTLTSEQKLINLYYQKDPNQQKLGY